MTATDIHGISETSPDGASDKSILENGRGKIVKTQEINVDYAPRRDDEQGVYEMNDLEGRGKTRHFG
jgi:hypothetical protein